jgi:hypothetical protein
VKGRLIVEGELDRVEFGLDDPDGVLCFRTEIGIFEADVAVEVSRVGFGRRDRGVAACCCSGFVNPISLRDRLCFKGEAKTFVSTPLPSLGSSLRLRYQSLGEEGSTLVCEKLR